MSFKFSDLKEKSPASVGLSAMPAVFVLLWSTGFIGAKFGLPYAEPFTFADLITVDPVGTFDAYPLAFIA